MKNLKKNQIESIVLNTAVIYFDYGEPTQREVGITKGGVEFTVTETVRDIEYDGRRGKTMGMVVIDEVNASLKTTTLELTNDNIFLTLGAATYNPGQGVIANTPGGVIDDSRFLHNVTAFGICNKNNSFKKIIIYNVLGPGGLTIQTADKSEAGLPMELAAHWDPADHSAPIYEIYDDEVGPQDAAVDPVNFTSVPANNATGVATSVEPKLTFNNRIASEAVQLIKQTDSSLVTISKAWDTDKKVLTITPDGALSAGIYHIIVAGVVDIYSQALAPATVKFTVA
jgi:hypothetical protein